MAVEADRLGFQIFVHAVGDLAVRRVLDGYALAQKTNGKRDSRHRVEHIEVIHPNDLTRFAELDVIASMQPFHCPPSADNVDVWTTRVGEGRWGLSFAWEMLRQAKARLAFGSDWPVVTQNPFIGIHMAVNRKPWRPYLPQQKQTLENTLIAYTRDAAYAEFQEQHKGQVREGFLADLVLVNADMFALPPETISELKPLVTLCDGRIVYEA
jgi:predicted amidohydrolase YtcJ